MSWYFVYLRYRLNQEFPLATLNAFLDGAAHKPFQFRMLVPWIVGGLRGMGFADVGTLYRAVDVAALIGGYYAIRYYLNTYLPNQAAFWAFGIFYALPWNYLLARDIPILLPYDLMAVTLTTLALALAAREKWSHFYPVFILGALNRETILFVTLALGIAYWGSRPKSKFALHIAAQLVIWLAVKFTMGAMYEGNPGQSFEYYHVDSQVPHWATNLNVLRNWPHLVMVLSTFGFMWAVIPVGWKRLSESFPRRSLWAVLPFVVMVLVIGNLNEIRVFGELFPFVFVPVALIASSVLRHEA